MSAAGGPAPPARVCAAVGGLLRLVLAVAAVLAVVAGLAELGLRAAGVQPRGGAEPTHLVSDRWTGFRLRPGVTGEEPHITNELGMHAPRSYPLAKPQGTLRVAVLGSSVVYGLDTSFRDTIPGVIERELQAAGHRAEALNFGTHGFSIVHVSALLQAYVHQFQPDVVVVVVDVQVGLPRWPAVRAVAPDEDVQQLAWWEALLTRGAPKSALLTVFNDPRPARRWARRASGLRLRPSPSEPAGRRPGEPEPDPDGSAESPATGSPATPRAYEERRERELAAPIAAMAAFCAKKSIALFLVTPYGPYFDLTDEELERMLVDLFLQEATAVHGSERAALGAEVELVTRVLRQAAAEGPARVIDMLDASRRTSPRSSPDFTWDGIHLSTAGNAAFGRTIARRILQDLDPGVGRRD